MGETLVTIDLTGVAGGADRRRTWDHLHLISALQGLVNRPGPRLYAELIDQGATDRHWLSVLRRPGGWLADRTLVPAGGIDDLLDRFAGSFKGLVVWDERVCATSLLASTAAGVEDLLPVRFDPSPDSLYQHLVRRRDLPVCLRLMAADGAPLFTGRQTGSAKCDAYEWAIDRYLGDAGGCDPALLAHYPDAWWIDHAPNIPAERTLLSNHDYFIAGRAFFFDLHVWEDEAPDDEMTQPPGTDARMLRRILDRVHQRAGKTFIHIGGFTPWDQKYTDYTGRPHGGVACEWRLVELASQLSAFLDADAASIHHMANASVYRHYPLKDRYPQPNIPTDDDLRAAGHLLPDGSVAPRDYVAFYVGDYDSAAWLYQMLPRLWDDPARGTVPLTWFFNPALERRFPVGMAYTRQTASPLDSFGAGDSGYGYVNPGAFNDRPDLLEGWERLCEAGYKRWDIRLTGFVIDGNTPPMGEAVLRSYARFSPGGVAEQYIPAARLIDGVPFLRMGHDLPDVEHGQKLIEQTFAAPADGPRFGLFRTVIWPAGRHADLAGRLQAANPRLAVVDAHTLFRLVRLSLH